MAHLIRKYAFPSDNRDVLQQILISPSVDLPSSSSYLHANNIATSTSSLSDVVLPYSTLSSWTEPAPHSKTTSYADLYLNKKPTLANNFLYPADDQFSKPTAELPVNFASGSATSSGDPLRGPLEFCSASNSSEGDLSKTPLGLNFDSQSSYNGLPGRAVVLSSDSGTSYVDVLKSSFDLPRPRQSVTDEIRKLPGQHSSTDISTPYLKSFSDSSHNRVGSEYKVNWSDLHNNKVTADNQDTVSNDQLSRILPSRTNDLADMGSRGVSTLRIGGVDVDTYRTTYNSDFRSPLPSISKVSLSREQSREKDILKQRSSAGSNLVKEARSSNISSALNIRNYGALPKSSNYGQDELRSSGYGSDEYYVKKMGEILNGFGRGLTFPASPTTITDYLFIGGYRDAENLASLRKLGITHVLNCAGNRRTCVNPYPVESGIIGYESFDADDIEFYDMLQHWQRAKSFIDRVKTKGGKVLVHCAMGVNRSGFICCAYLMSAERMPLLEAVRHMKQKRVTVLCNPGFQRQLLRFARQNGCL